LCIYGFAMLANASGRLFATTLFALGDTKRPARYAICRVVASTAIALMLMWRLGVVGVVIGAACAGWLEAGLLAAQVRKRLGGLGLEQVRWVRLLLLAGLAVGAPWGVRALLPPSFAPTPLGSAVVLTALGLTFAVAAQGLGLLDLRSLLRRGR
jgi:putative peptidoglycan lipid II flippase